MLYKIAGVTQPKSLSLKANVERQNRGAVVGRDRLTWRTETNGCLALYSRKGRRALVGVEPDRKNPRLYRVRFPDADLSDTTNLTRAKDVAMVFALRHLNLRVQETATERPRGRQEPARPSDGSGRSKRMTASPDALLAVSGQEP